MFAPRAAIVGMINRLPGCAPVFLTRTVFEEHFQKLALHLHPNQLTKLAHKWLDHVSVTLLTFAPTSLNPNSPFAQVVMTTQESHKTGSEDAPKCPVDHSAFKHFLPGSSASDHSQLPKGHPSVPRTTPDGEPAKCPVSHEAHKHFLAQSGHPNTETSLGTGTGTGTEATGKEGLKINPTNNMPATPDQFRTTSQRLALNTEREMSSIPKASSTADPYGSSSGAHAPDPDSDKEKLWIYPSEQMFFNAMKRKNHNAREEDMKFVVPIHNMVNEMAWRHILKWEKLAAK